MCTVLHPLPTPSMQCFRSRFMRSFNFFLVSNSLNLLHLSCFLRFFSLHSQILEPDKSAIASAQVPKTLEQPSIRHPPKIGGSHSPRRGDRSIESQARESRGRRICRKARSKARRHPLERPSANALRTFPLPDGRSTGKWEQIRLFSYAS